MRRLAVVVISLALTVSAAGKEVFLSITGKASGFFTDARIFNPSFTKTITINAQYLPAGNGDNTTAPAVQLSIAPRQMKLYDDAVQSMFGGGPQLGAIRLVSDDDFVAMQRIYQDARTGPQKGTLGQFVPGLDISAAKTKGVVLQLKSGDSAIGNFKTNWGGANPNPTVANISFKLYDRNNALAGTTNLTLQPYGVFSPANIVNFFGVSGSVDLSDAWMSFVSDKPIFVYGSVVDNGSVDPTFVPASDDSGVPPAQPEPNPTVKTVSVSVFSFGISLQMSSPLAPGDQARFVITGGDGVHGFLLFSPTGNAVINVDPVPASGREQTITLEAGRYDYVCTRPTCGTGHNEMVGSFNVGGGDDDRPDYIKP